MKVIERVFTGGFFIITILFLLCALSLVIFAAMEFWHAVDIARSVDLRARFNSMLEVIGLLTIAVAALELGQTILEEEVKREAQMNVPTRVRRFLSRFMLVIVVALSIEFLVAVFQLIHDNPAQLTHASTIGLAAAALLVAWGVFVKLNIGAERLEPEAMEQVKEEDKKVT